jgi:hypothetical protein
MAPVMIASQRRPGAAELERGETGGSGMGAEGRRQPQTAPSGTARG